MSKYIECKLRLVQLVYVCAVYIDSVHIQCAPSVPSRSFPSHCGQHLLAGPWGVGTRPLWLLIQVRHIQCRHCCFGAEHWRGPLRWVTRHWGVVCVYCTYMYMYMYMVHMLTWSSAFFVSCLYSYNVHDCMDTAQGTASSAYINYTKWLWIAYIVHVHTVRPVCIPIDIIYGIPLQIMMLKLRGHPPVLMRRDEDFLAKRFSNTFTKVSHLPQQLCN